MTLFGTQEWYPRTETTPHRPDQAHQNPPFSRLFAKMDLTGALSNHDLQGSLARLAEELASVRAGGAQRRWWRASGFDRDDRAGWSML